MSYNKKYNPDRVFWNMLKLNKCPRLGCDGTLVRIGGYYECDMCINFKISIKKYYKQGGR